jgi:hypothetical protein
MESMFIHLADRPSAECVEICDGVVLDFDSEGILVGIDIDKVSSLPEKLAIPENLPMPTTSSTGIDSSDD